MIVLGIDPGSDRTGFGIVSYRQNRLSSLYWGLAETKDCPTFSAALRKIHLELTRLVTLYKPDFAAVEDIFYAVNVRSALKLGHTRGAILLSLELVSVPAFSYTPLEIKKALTGYGRAGKEQVQSMVQLLLNLKGSSLPLDASDALAAAICHAQSYTTRLHVNGRQKTERELPDKHSRQEGSS